MEEETPVKKRMRGLAGMEESMGQAATRIAEEHAKKWMESALPCITQKVFDTAARGLFHCQLRFEDDVPMDPVNQARLRKVLEKENLNCNFQVTPFDEQKATPGNVTLTIHWGPELL